MKISREAEEYADSIFFNVSRTIHAEKENALRKHRFVSHEDTAQEDFRLSVVSAAKMAEARMQSYVDAYEKEGETIEHGDVLEFIQRAKDVIARQSQQISTASGGTITVVRNNWSPHYREEMQEFFRNEAFHKIEPKMNELILKSKEAPLKRAIRKKMKKRNDVFRWIFEQSKGETHRLVQLQDFLVNNSELSIRDLEVASDYLADEGLIDQKDDSGLLVWLTHQGLKAGESESDVVGIDSSMPRTQATQTNNTFYGPVGAVQTGNFNTANVSGTDLHIAEIRELLRSLSGHLIHDGEEHGRNYIDLVAEEINKEKPQVSRVRSLLNAVGGYVNETGKSIVAEIVAKIVTKGADL
jgi:hypothetical protein